ncbi:cytochrome c oxidase assembly protein [Mycobacterium sp. Marseille-P9652]|uniref:cytochrome c oxidase assembly protein n=1 Tax=Mycobacterium sp. Marseille-P9652 TaxID=2654950 RepID=UPI0012E7FA39|nr:cytochrome c oxidase assembly protein [Mycobacterium sp. Marseille-P9652]
MRVDTGPLTWGALAHTWHFDPTAAVVIVVAAGAYGWCYRAARRESGRAVGPGSAVCFGVGVGLWIVATMSAVGAYAYVLFWVRALQVLLLLYVVSFFVALGKPVTVLRLGLGAAGRRRVDRLLDTRFARVLAHPLTTSLVMLGVPWLLYLTPWYTASLRNEWVGAPTRILLVLAGFGYFYARLQADPVPRRYPQTISLLITVAEALGDGVLGLVLWQGALIGSSYYAELHRSWGPDPRLDQTIGAGVLWILGDLVGWPLVLLLMRALSRDDKAHAVEVDAQLDAAREDESGDVAPSGLWWENDPQLRERFGRG